MFEQEAEEYREKEKDKGYYWVTQEMEQSELDTIVDESFKDGAEFGFQEGIKTKVNTTTISDCPVKDDWHKQDIDDIYDLISEDWSVRYFVCIMKDKKRVTAMGNCDEDYNGGVSVNLFFDHEDNKYYMDDIMWWKEIVLPELPKENEQC